MAKSKPSEKAEPETVKYKIEGSRSRSNLHRNNYNALDAIYNSDKLYTLLTEEINQDFRLVTQSKGNVAQSQKNFSQSQKNAEPSRNDVISFKEIFCENSRGYYLLTMITRDCHEKGEDVVAYQVLNTFYECACLWQLVEARNLVKSDDDGDGDSKSNKMLSARMHKGHLTFDLANICGKLGWSWHRRYFLALTLAEDALSHFVHVQHGSEFCDLLLANADAFREFEKAVLNKQRKDSDEKRIDHAYLKFLVSPAAEEHWKEPDEDDKQGGDGSSSHVRKLETRIARFWRRTGLCQTLRTEFGLSLPDVMAWVIQIVKRVFVQDRKNKSIKPLGLYHDFESKIWFADVQNWKRVGWGAAWLGFPEWVASQAGLFEVLSCPIAHNEVFSAPFNAAYYGYLCQSLMELDGGGSSGSVSSQRGELVRNPDDNASQVHSRNEEPKQTKLSHQSNSKGLLFEELAAYLCTATPGVRVLRNARSGAGELDLIGYVSPGSSLLHPVTGNHFLGECKWELQSTAVDVIDALAARAKRMQTDSVIVFSRKGLSGEGSDDNAERLIHAEAMGGVSFAPLSGEELLVEFAAGKFFDQLTKAVKNLDRIELSSIRGLMRFRFPKLLRESFDKHRFGFYGSNKIEQ